MKIRLGVAFTILAGLVVALQAAPAQTAPAQAAVDKVFAAWNTSTPGCAIGVAENGVPVLQRAYGMADLEHAAPNTPDTIFEAGSVSKQFTAAAMILLARDGKVSLDDDVRKYVPELPAYQAPVTIRHMLSHTSGLRDWGSLAGIAGMPRGSRVYTHGHVVDLLSRQTTLNFAPGTRWSYSNSGYNLAAVIIARVSGMSFAEFSRTRLFQPLGLTRTSWRDDYARVIPGRAIGYSMSFGRFVQDMPFENVHGNGGLLTTVGDLLKWQAALTSGPLKGAALADEQQTLAKLNDGRELHYGLGVFRGTYKGVPEVYHSGATAGYRAFLTEYPSAKLTIAVLCNAGNAAPATFVRAVSDLYLGDKANANAPRSTVLPEAEGPLTGVKADPSYRPTTDELAAFSGTYDSAEIETQFIARVDNGALVLSRRPDARITLRPHSRDRFEAGAGLGQVTFHRKDGVVVALSITQDRVWDLRVPKTK
ncbi:MAG: beta-lactamase family protein [Acidobacteria bacterium]|jgi:CubicO group peptidase (beta-lactamase class C family)|nr:beta-lactamase family protein [Acidobacteriota bacterium]